MPWQPAHEAHAIERASVTFQFAEAIPSKLWQAVLNRATLEYQSKSFNSTVEGIELNLGHMIAGQAAVFPGGIAGGSPGPHPVVGALPIPGAAARTFRSLVGSQVWEEISLSPTRFVYFSTRYDHWLPFRQRAYDLLETAIDQALQVVDLPVIKAEYWDRFTFDGQPSDANYRDLLNSQSKYMPSFYFDLNELWHSHVGLFMPATHRGKRLINLNVDAFDFADTATPNMLRRSVGIYSMGQDTMDAHSLSASSDTVTVVNDLHSVLKEVLGDVILSEMAERIGLNGNVGP